MMMVLRREDEVLALGPWALTGTTLRIGMT